MSSEYFNTWNERNFKAHLKEDDQNSLFYYMYKLDSFEESTTGCDDWSNEQKSKESNSTPITEKSLPQVINDNQALNQKEETTIKDKAPQELKGFKNSNVTTIIPEKVFPSQKEKDEKKFNEIKIFFKSKESTKPTLIENNKSFESKTSFNSPKFNDKSPENNKNHLEGLLKNTENNENNGQINGYISSNRIYFITTAKKNYENIKKTNKSINNKKNIKRKPHNKFYLDSKIKKIKSFIYKVIINFFNNNYIKHGKSKLRKLEKKITSDTHVKSNKALLEKSLKEILSLSSYNKKIIDKLYANSNFFK